MQCCGQKQNANTKTMSPQVQEQQHQSYHAQEQHQTEDYIMCEAELQNPKAQQSQFNVVSNFADQN